MRNKFDTNLLILQYNTIFIYKGHLKTTKAVINNKTTNKQTHINR